jgi:hypothetical protein
MMDCVKKTRAKEGFGGFYKVKKINGELKKVSQKEIRGP